MRDRTLQPQRKQKDRGEGPTWLVSIIDERMVGGPHLPLYVLQELIGIQCGKEEKNCGTRYLKYQSIYTTGSIPGKKQLFPEKKQQAQQICLIFL